ncbi:hypothetical protein GTQ99_05345 [Kineococcus sp. T13]|uniref:hypothetical protein n=1 Tax=Kineococcus vitellinus TaxID=2696565 RepID=UPI0014128F18|nr:hypothetical protein [Kineococcus vitellinus]NAZ74850.1 hypothetical protein [Kineococcus vitellinus]
MIEDPVLRAVAVPSSARSGAGGGVEAHHLAHRAALGEGVHRLVDAVEGGARGDQGVDRHLGPVLACDAERGTQLARTAAAVLEEGSRTAAAADETARSTTSRPAPRPPGRGVTAEPLTSSTAGATTVLGEDGT